MTPTLPPPSRRLWLAETPRLLAGLGRLPFAWRGLVAAAPPGDGHPVLLVPGLITTERSLVVLRRLLETIGYAPHGWGLGRNLGPRTIGDDGERLVERLEAVADAAGRPVSVIGVSLGGMMARLLGHRRPALVRQVVTVASPFAGSPRSTNAWRTYQWATGASIDAPAARALVAECAAPPPVPHAAIWSPSDGVVNGQICRGDAACRNFEVRSGHYGVHMRVEVLRILAEQLAAVPEPAAS